VAPVLVEVPVGPLSPFPPVVEVGVPVDELSVAEDVVEPVSVDEVEDPVEDPVVDEPVSVEEDPVLVDEEPVPVDEDPVSVEEEPVAVDEEPVPVEEEPVDVVEPVVLVPVVDPVELLDPVADEDAGTLLEGVVLSSTGAEVSVRLVHPLNVPNPPLSTFPSPQA